jgi:hypothetical protein
MACQPVAMRALGLILVALGFALAVYSIPMGSYVALAAFLAGIAMVVFGVRMFGRA